MRNVTDSLALFLHQELGGTPTVHRMSSTPDDPDSCVFQHDAVNVKGLGYSSADRSIAEVLVSVDIVGSDEDTVADWCFDVNQALLTEMAPEIEFNDGAVVPTGRQVFWEQAELTFTHVHTAEGYVHFNLTLPVRHQQRYT
jgi:hypothetical protein